MRVVVIPSPSDQRMKRIARQRQRGGDGDEQP
jgi:hypothetical protein